MRATTVLTIAILTTFSASCSSRPEPIAAPSVCPHPVRPSDVVKKSIRRCCAVEKPDKKWEWRPGYQPLGTWLADVAVLNGQLEACRR